MTRAAELYLRERYGAHHGHPEWRALQEAFEAGIRAALAQEQAEPEPVAWMKEGWGPDCGPYVEFYRDDEMGWRDRKEWTPLYTAPPAPKREPLTDDALKSLLRSCDWRSMSLAVLARAVERAHGIGSEG